VAVGVVALHDGHGAGDHDRAVELPPGLQHRRLRFPRRLDPEQPYVQASLINYLAEGIMTAINAERRAKVALPLPADPLVGPVMSAQGLRQSGGGEGHRKRPVPILVTNSARADPRRWQPRI
jgi:hypothetical protein